MMHDYTEAIRPFLGYALHYSSLGIGSRKQGKVRDIYDLDQYLLLVTSDRVSAFDRVLADVPLKGQVLNQISAWWFNKTKHIIPNHVLAVPDPNVVISKKCKVFPIEFVVRGYITGTTSTSMWTNYAQGVRDYCGHSLPEGLVQNQKLEKNLVTPTTKDDFHDRLISPEEIISEGWMTKEQWEYCSQKALELFAFGQEEAAKHGLILVDTKYEMGVEETENGPVITLVDEIHTPDSSRYWIKSSYEERMKTLQSPENIDKDILRRWYNQNCDPYKDEVLPKAPSDLVVTLSNRYIQLFELITGEKFQFPASYDLDLNDRIDTNLRASLLKDTGLYAKAKKIHIFFDLNAKHKLIEETLTAVSSTGLSYTTFHASEVVGSQELLKKIQQNQIQAQEKEVAIVNIVRSQSIGLGNFIAANQKFPTIFCPVIEASLDSIAALSQSLNSAYPLLVCVGTSNTAACASKILEIR